MKLKIRRKWSIQTNCFEWYSEKKEAKTSDKIMKLDRQVYVDLCNSISQNQANKKCN